MVYFDHAATTPILPEVLEAYVAAARTGGNASALHNAGRRARRLVEESRERLAAALGARPSEVVFTAGGTESDNLAIKGIFWARRATSPSHNRILASAIEHKAVTDTVEWLQRHQGAEVTWLDVDPSGRVQPDVLHEALGPDVAITTVMWANNEVGTVQPIATLAESAAAQGIPLHTDAVQAIGQLPVDFATSGASALTLSGHKLGGPTGVGALLLTRDTACTPLLHGGGQERDVRSGTLDVAGIAALSVAVELAVRRQVEFATELTELRDYLIAQVKAAIPGALLNGHPTRRLPANAHFTFPGCEGDALLMLLDAQGIACSTGSACNAGVAQPSHVLLAMGVERGLARSALRFSLGHGSTRTDIDRLVAALPDAVERAMRAGRIRR